MDGQGPLTRDRQAPAMSAAAGDLKRFRAVATRYYETACCHLATLHFASMLLRLN